MPVVLIDQQEMVVIGDHLGHGLCYTGYGVNYFYFSFSIYGYKDISDFSLA